MEKTKVTLPPAPKPPLQYAPGDARGIQTVPVTGTREVRRAIVKAAGANKLELSSWKQQRNGETYLAAKIVVKGSITAYDLFSGYYLGEWVGEKKVIKIEFEQLTDRKGLLGKSNLAFAFLYTFGDLSTLSNEIASAGSN